MNTENCQPTTNPDIRMGEIPFSRFVEFNIDSMNLDKICFLPSAKEFDKVLNFIENTLERDEKCTSWCIIAKECLENGKEAGKILATCVEVPDYPGKQLFMTTTV